MRRDFFLGILLSLFVIAALCVCFLNAFVLGEVGVSTVTLEANSPCETMLVLECLSLQDEFSNAAEVATDFRHPLNWQGTLQKTNAKYDLFGRLYLSEDQDRGIGIL